MKYTKDQILQIVEEEDVEFIRMQFTDIFGTLKNAAITASQLEDALEGNLSFEGTFIDGFMKSETADLFLRPDLETFEIIPWRPQSGKVARMICEICNPDGSPFEGGSRYALRKVLQKAAEMGYEMQVSPEMEFFLLQCDEEGRPTTKTADRAQYFDLAPLDSGENARRDIIINLEHMGFEVTRSHHEKSPQQQEIDLGFREALRAADDIVTFKFAVRSIAKLHGMHATFMPKPLKGYDGSGMHIFIKVMKDGKNIFGDPEGACGISKEGYSFIAGVLAEAAGMSVICSPLVNSYKRLLPGYHAPVNIGWSEKNGSQMVRIPYAKKGEERFELRNPDSACNPYLTFAAILASGLMGIEKGLSAEEYKSGEDDEITLPGNLHEAIRAFEKDEFLQDVLGQKLSKQYISEKRKEWRSFREEVSEWELDQYLYRI